MTITDSKRTDIHNCLRDLMGHDMADIMMEFLPRWDGEKSSADRT